MFLKLTGKGLIFFIFLLFLFYPAGISINEFSVFRVVIDPGHGGVFLFPREKNGDRYDAISEKYLSFYNPGTSLGQIEERNITYSIALKIKNILDLTRSNGEFLQFREIIKKYTDDDPGRIIINADLSRAESIDKTNINNDDVNANYRLFDYVDKNGNKKPGRISYINSFKPQLVVTLHCDFRAQVYFRGINPVIAPPYSILYRGLDYLKGNQRSKSFFYRSPYSDWFAESVNRSAFDWFLKDSSVYFTGFPNDKAGKIGNLFKGYIYNMVTWHYADSPGWELTARNHPENSQYAVQAKNFIPSGKFWDREKSVYESYRREGGIEGFGGDNLYAASEIIRYILYSLNMTGNYNPGRKLGKPYISVWSVPILINAINAYIELGYLKRNSDRFIMTKKQDEIAEGIAVGIYSLFAGLKPRKTRYKYIPVGKNIDFEKYSLPSGVNYFEMAAP